VFNAPGFVSHFQMLTGPTVGNYRLVEPTVSGHLALLQVTGHLVAISMGWPLIVASVCGLVLALSNDQTRLTAAWLLLTAVTYYIGVIDLVLYAYDRFVLPLCFIGSLFGGLAIDRLLAHGTRQTWRRALVAGAFAYSVLYAATVDVLMLRDSRYATETWMQARSPRRDFVATLGLPEYRPALEGFPQAPIGSVIELQATKPRFVVFNADYERTVPRQSQEGELLAGFEDGRLGYGLVWRYRQPSPWQWLPWPHPDLVGSREETVVLSTLRDINPTIEVYERREPSAPLTP
jgi:hypothetical protein